MTDKLTTIRLSTDALKRADTLAARMGRDPEVRAGAGRVTRSYVLRVAIERGLQSLEQEHKPQRRRKRR